MMLEYLICYVTQHFVGARLGLEARQSVVCAQCCVVLCLMYCSHFELASAVTRRDRSDGGLRSVRGAWHPLHHNTAGGCCRSYQLTAASETMQDVSTQSTLASSPCLVMVSR